MDPAEEWLLVNRHKTLEQLRADLQHGPVPSTAESAERIWAENGVTSPEPQKDAMQAQVEEQRLQSNRRHAFLSHYIESEEGGQLHESTFLSQRAISEEQQLQQSSDQALSPTHTQGQHNIQPFGSVYQPWRAFSMQRQISESQQGNARQPNEWFRKQARSGYSESSSPQHLDTQLPQQSNLPGRTEGKSRPQPFRSIELAQHPEQGQSIELLPPGWEYVDPSSMMSSSSYYLNRNDGTTHRDLPAPVKQLEQEIATGQMIQRKMAGRQDGARKIGQRNPGDTIPDDQGMSPEYGGFDGAVHKLGPASNSTLSGTFGENLLSKFFLQSQYHFRFLKF